MSYVPKQLQDTMEATMAEAGLRAKRYADATGTPCEVSSSTSPTSWSER